MSDISPAFSPCTTRLLRYALPVGLELTPLRFDTTPMSSEVHGNGLGDEGKAAVVTPSAVLL
jgi:hypothetical protein